MIVFYFTYILMWNIWVSIILLQCYYPELTLVAWVFLCSIRHVRSSGAFGISHMWSNRNLSAEVCYAIVSKLAMTCTTRKHYYTMKCTSRIGHDKNLMHTMLPVTYVHKTSARTQRLFVCASLTQTSEAEENVMHVLFRNGKKQTTLQYLRYNAMCTLIERRAYQE